MTTGTVRFHRVLMASPERVYRAFLDADALAKWLPPYGFSCKVHPCDDSHGHVLSGLAGATHATRQLVEPEIPG